MYTGPTLLRPCDLSYPATHTCISQPPISPPCSTRGNGKTDEELRGMLTNLFNEYLMHRKVEETLSDWYELGRDDK